MIIDFRVTVPSREYAERIPREEAQRQAREGTGRGYTRVYRENLQGRLEILSREHASQYG